MSDWEHLSPREQAAHPSTPLEKLRYLAHFHPTEVLQNPIVPLLYLESAQEAHELVLIAQKNEAEQRIESILPKLQENIRRLWLCDCAERVVPFYETQNPGEHAPSEALQLAREYITGNTTISALLAHQAELLDTQKQRRGVIYGAPPSIDSLFYRAQEVLPALVKIIGRQLPSNDSFDISASLAKIASRIALTKVPLDLTKNQHDEREKIKEEAYVAEVRWQASRLEEREK